MALSQIYKHSLALLTDLYELTMAFGYWKLGMTEKQAAFHLTFRENPFAGGFTVACGLKYAIDFIENFHFDDDDLAYLSTLKGNDQQPLFEPAFLDYLRDLKLTIGLDATPEGTVVFPHEPIVRVTGPILQAQIVETALLNMINFQTLVATKAARVCLATRGEPVIEFGLRRAQGIDGGIAASRASFVGGCAGTSNLLAGKLFGIPVLGTHAHSWVMSFESEREAFEAYARAMPNNCVFLVDTYDTLRGVRRATEVGKELRASGHEMVGIRLDSGDLAYLSIQAKRILDEQGFPNARIVASNDLDEHIIDSLKDQDAKINVWGVGTRLATAYDQPALGGVYKLTAIRDDASAPWEPRVKLSEQTVKISTPGVLQVRRYRAAAGSDSIADAIFDANIGVSDETVIVDPLDMTRRKHIPRDAPHEDLLVPIFRAGRRVYDVPDIRASRQRAFDQLATFHPGIKRFVNPHRYPVGLEQKLHDRRTELILNARGRKNAGEERAP